jgi:predicted DNA-binding protein (UPF0251 family)
MPRQKKCRRLYSLPDIKGFKPIGIPRKELNVIIIEYDEYEAFKLVAYEKLAQEEAAHRMEVSRPTLTRMYHSALGKIAKALVEECAIEIGGENFIFTGNQFQPKRCCMKHQKTVEE